LLDNIFLIGNPYGN